MPRRLFRLTAEARSDLAGIHRWIARHGGAPHARAMIERIARSAALFGGQPSAGLRHPELGKGTRAFLVSPYRVVYRPRDGYIDILRVIHTHRDLGTAWAEGELP